jgi:hypothetical protein
MAHAIEAIPTDGPMLVSRMTVELLRPVGMAPLEVETSVPRPGRRVQLAAASVSAEGVEVARATALRIRTTDLKLETAPREEPTMPGPAKAPSSGTPVIVGFGTAMDIRFVKGDFFSRGPAAVWFRLRYPIIAGEANSSLMRVVAAADFGNGVSHELDFLQHIFINPDLTVYLHRYPRGEWICLDARTQLSDQGVGLAESRIYDEAGPIGRSVQALFLDRR